MAGSYNHCVEKPSGKLLNNLDLVSMIENGGDVYEAVEEFYGMVWYLANGKAARVEDARQSYAYGLFLSPGVDGSLADEDSA
jgi:hypothetical protein